MTPTPAALLGVLLFLSAVTLWAAVTLLRVPHQARARAERRERERVADEQAMEQVARTDPHLAAAVRASEVGAGYDPSMIYRRTSHTPWIRPGGPADPARCPTCDTTAGLTLVWVEAREEGARFVCPMDAHVWCDPAWATEAALAWVTAQPLLTSWTTHTPQEVPPATWELMERMRREAGTTPPP
ncbi:hypothetical protein [Nocardiopsis sp. NPDC006938]|uniref:hypothetical protein n=1 Tax=Nocardiopsis sp. NPDC006938 TaxID=3364337 RepID=UPI0036BF4630